MFNENPVFVERQFQYRVELFSRKITLGNDLLGKINYFAITIESQFPDSTYIYSFPWILNPSKLNQNIIEN